MDSSFLKRKFAESSNLGRQLDGLGELADLLQTSVQLGGKLAEAEACYIWRVGPQIPLLQAAYSQRRKLKSPCLANSPRLTRLLNSQKPRFQSAAQTERNPFGEGLSGKRAALFPLIVECKPWGMLVFWGGEGKDFSEEERLLLQHIADRIESALRLNLLAARDLHLQEQISEVMLGFAESLSLARDPENYLRLICEIFLRLSQADLCLVWKITDPRPLRLAACSPFKRAYKVSETVALNLVKKTLRDKIPVGWRQGEASTPGSALALPLRGQTALVGVITLFWKNCQAYGETTKRLLSAFAHYIEFALEHILLQQTDKKTQAQLTELESVGRQIGELPAPQLGVGNVLRAISRTLHCPMVGLAMLSSDDLISIAHEQSIGIPAGLLSESGFCLRPTSLTGSSSGKPRPLLQTELAADPLASLLQAESLVYIPLQGPREPRGVLFAAYRQTHKFPDIELALLSTYANQIALVLRNAELADGHTRNLEQLATISEISRGFSHSPEIRPLLQTTLTSVCRLLSLPGGLILFDSENGAGLCTATVYDQDPKAKRFSPIARLEEQGNLSALAIRQNKVAVSADLARDGRLNYRALARKGGPLSAIAAPLAAGGKIFGAICAFSWEARTFPENDKRVFSTIADNLGVAIDNSRRREAERRQSAAYSELFREVNRQVRGSLQTIVSLLEITSAETNLSGEAALRRALQRIQCIHLIHSLIHAKPPNQMEIREGTRQIAELAQSGLGRRPEEVNIGVSGTRTFLSSQKATAFSLAVNELIHNALKHGLQEPSGGKININFSQSGGQLLVEVSDNGCGLPESFDLAKDAGLGLRLTVDFVQQQLAGEFRLFRRPGASGTTAQIRFPC